MPRVIGVKPAPSGGDVTSATFDDGAWAAGDGVGTAAGSSSSAGEGGDDDGRRSASDSGGSAGPARLRPRHRLTKLLVSWSSTVPDAVGIPGIRYVNSSQHHSLRRAMWSMALLGALVIASQQIIDRIVFYYSNPKGVNLAIQYVDNLTFPAVTVCNYNKYRITHGLTPFLEMVSAYTDNYYNHDEVNLTQYQAHLSGVNTTQLFLDLAHRADTSLVFGLWSGYWLSVQNFSNVFTDFGVCFTFNAGLNGEALSVQTVAGQQGGLDMVVDTQRYYYYTSLPLDASSGFLIAVHDRDEIPEVSALGVGVSPGTAARIGIRTKQTTNLPPPHGKCGSRKLRHFDGYSMNKCRRDCLIDFVLEACGCVEPFMAVSDGVRVCDPLEVYTCVYREKERYNLDENKQCTCPIPCSIRSYTTSVSYTRYPARFFNNELREFYSQYYYIPPNTYSDNFVRFIVYMEDLTIEHIDHQADYSFFTLLCDIGGALGLWLGGSILTFVEILDHAIYSICVPAANPFQYKK